MTCDDALLEFLSRDCKSDKHNECNNKWFGLGFKVLCRCDCHIRKKALEEAPNPATNAAEIIQSPGGRFLR